MHIPLTDRGSWPWWLGSVLVLSLWALWREPAPEHAPATAPVPAARIAIPVPAPAAVAPLAAPPGQAAAQAPGPLPPLRLIGTVLAGAGSMATVRLSSGSQLLQLRVGDRVEGLVVTAIEPDRIALGGADHPIVIEAETTATSPAPPVPSSPALPPASRPAPPAWAEGEAPWDLAPPFKH
jgi:hypothetical protein